MSEKKYGNNVIHIEHKNNIPENKKLFTIKVLNGHTELIPNKGITPELILKYLLDNNIEIIKYGLDYPSLNEIFIDVTENKINE